MMCMQVREKPATDCRCIGVCCLLALNLWLVGLYTAEVGVQTSPSLAELPSGVRRPAGASPDSKLEYGQAAKQPSPAAAANKPTLAPGTQQGAKGRPSSAMQPQSSKPPARQPTRRVTRQSSTAAAALAAASAGQPSKGATSSKAGAPVVSFSRKRNQPPQQQEDAVQQPSPKRRQATQQPAAQAPAPPVSMFDLLFGGATAEEPQQKQPHRPVAQREAEPLGAAQVGLLGVLVTLAFCCLAGEGAAGALYT